MNKSEVHLARAEWRSEFYKTSQSQSERDCSRGQLRETDSLSEDECSVLREESLSAGWERNVSQDKETTGDVKTVSASRETGSQCHRSWIQSTVRETPCDFPSEAGEGFKWKNNVRDVWTVFRRDVTGILKSADSQRNGILKCDSPHH